MLEHVPDTVGFLTEARRVLKPGGRILVTVPDHGVARGAPRSRSRRHEQHYDPLGQHLRFYTRRSLAGALEATGFDAHPAAPASRPGRCRAARSGA